MRDPGEELRTLERDGLRRRLRPLDSAQGPRVTLAGQKSDCLNFSSNDYLGLATDDGLKKAYQENIERFGVGSGSSRLVCGTMAPHLALEEKIAALKKTEAAITYSSGFAAATGSLPAICGKTDLLILDKLCHASLIDGARLSRATLRVFPHNDLNRLESHLQWARRRVDQESRILVVTESVFSMDGDLAPLREIVELKERYGALLFVDEAHALGVIGPRGRGLAASLGLEGRVDFQMGTFSKAVGLSGGYLCSKRAMIDLLINRSRSLIYSTAPSPALAATVTEALELVCGERGDHLRADLLAHRRAFATETTSAIFPVLFGENEAALAASEALLEKGFLVPAIRYPTVPKGSARLRITLSAAHRSDEISSLKNALADLQKTVTMSPLP